MQKLDLSVDLKNRHALVGPPHLWRMKRDFQIEFLKKIGLSRALFARSGLWNLTGRNSDNQLPTRRSLLWC